MTAVAFVAAVVVVVGLLLRQLASGVAVPDLWELVKVGAWVFRFTPQPPIVAVALGTFLYLGFAGLLAATLAQRAPARSRLSESRNYGLVAGAVGGMVATEIVSVTHAMLAIPLVIFSAVLVGVLASLLSLLLGRVEALSAPS